VSEPSDIEQAIAKLEAQRALLGDAVADTALAALREKLVALAGARGRSPQERKHVTVLFADIVGYTAIAERMDPEDLADTLKTCFRHWSEIIARHGGVVEKFIGDAVVAVFGLPVAQENDPAQAIRAALEMLEVEGWKLEGGSLVRPTTSNFQIRIGIHSGPVLVSLVGRQPGEDFVATGDTVNVASRLQSAAPPGGILISHDTYRLVRGLFEVEPQPPMMLKGKEQPCRTYLVLRARPRAFRMATRGVEGIETRTIGRDSELRALQGAFHTVVERSQALRVTIVGEAGVGKSRLLYEFENWLELLPQLVTSFKGRASPERAHSPYGLLRDLFRDRFDILESDTAAVVRSKFEAGMAPHLDPDRADLVGQLVGFDFSTSPAVQNLLGNPAFSDMARADLLRYFRGVTAGGPVAFFFEDIHWADNPSLDLIRSLPEELPDCRLMIVCLARPTLYERWPEWDAPALLPASPSAEEAGKWLRLNLEPLSPADSRALVGEILQKVEEVPAGLGDLLVEHAEGNPFYLEELIKMLIEDGVIIPGEERWQVRQDRLGGLRVPTTLQRVLQARLDSLPAAEKDLLQRAAVIGRIFWDRTLAEIGEQATAESGDHLEEALQALMSREMIFRRERSVFAGAREYVFKHALLREVTYETVLRKERRRYHCQVAAWLEAHCGERLNEYAGLIAEHYERAGESTQAAVWLDRAGQVALQTSAFGEAIAAWERSLALLPPEERASRAALLIRLGNAYEHTTDYATARERLQAGLTLARDAHDDRAAAEALCGLSLIAMRQADYEQGRALGEEALALARRAEDCAAAALALRRLGTIAFYQGDLPGARRHLEEGLALERKNSNRQGVAVCLNNLGLVLMAQGDYAASTRCYEESLSLHRAMGDRCGTASGLINLGNVAMHQEDYARATRYFEDGLAIVREIGDKQGTAFCLISLGWTAWLQGDYEAAARETRESLVLFREMGDRQGVASGLNNLGHVAASLGEPGQAEEHYRQALKVAWEIGALPLVLETLAGLARLRAQAGQSRAAAELLGLALHHPAGTGDVVRAARPARELLAAALSPAELEAALSRGRDLELDAVVQGLLGEMPQP